VVITSETTRLAASNWLVMTAPQSG
jgi:hypothetical protein